jgi:hypothetical protein
VSTRIEFGKVTPILRILDIAKADEFCLGFLGCKIDWDHRFDDNAPLYRQVSRGELILQLSEHHGDGCPGARIRVSMVGVKAFQKELIAKGYRYMRPGLEKTPWNTIETGSSTPSAITSDFSSRLSNRPYDARMAYRSACQSQRRRRLHTLRSAAS